MLQPDLLDRKHTLVHIGTLAVLCGHYTICLMHQELAPPPQVTKERASWKTQELDALLDFLHEHRAEGGDGGTFKRATFNRAAVHISPYLQAGPAKTGEMCKSKWNSMKVLYRDINSYRNRSGVHWDNVNGAGISGTDASDTWEAYVQGVTSLRPYKTAGWTYLDRVEAVLGVETARGGHAFHPGSGPASTMAAAQAVSSSTSGSVVQTDARPGGRGAVVSSLVVDSGFAPSERMAPSPINSTLMLPPGPRQTATSSRAESSTGSRQSGKKRSHHDMTSNHDDASPMRATPGPSNYFPPSTSSVAPSGIIPLASKFRQESMSVDNETSPSMSKKTKKVANTAVAVMGMQGSLNRLTDTIERTMTAPEEKQVERKQMALRIMEEQDCDLPDAVQIVLMEIIRKDQGFADLYCIAANKNRRVAWIKTYIRENNLQAAVDAAAADIAAAAAAAAAKASAAAANAAQAAAANVVD